MLFKVALVVAAALAIATVSAHRGGGPRGGGEGRALRAPLGPLHAVMPKLTDTQRHELFATLKQTRNATKGEVIAKLEAFTATLTPELREAVSAAKEQWEARRAADELIVKTLSPEAQELFVAVQTLYRDNSLTFAETHENVHALLTNASPRVKSEFTSSKINLLCLHGRPHGERLGQNGKRHQA